MAKQEDVKKTIDEVTDVVGPALHMFLEAINDNPQIVHSLVQIKDQVLVPVLKAIRDDAWEIEAENNEKRAEQYLLILNKMKHGLTPADAVSATNCIMTRPNVQVKAAVI